MNSIQVSRIPSRHIFRDVGPDEVLRTHRLEFMRMLSEIHHIASTDDGDPSDTAVEIVWSTERVENQTYSSAISLLFVVRAIDRDKESAERTNELISSVVCNTLGRMRYEFEECDRQTFDSKAGKPCASCQMMVKDETVETSSVPFIDAVYLYGLLHADSSDLSGLVGFLSNRPGVVIHLQLIPSLITEGESAALTDYVQKVSVASHGVMARGIGQVQYPQAEQILDHFQPYYDLRSGPLFTFNIVVRGDGTSAKSTVSQLAGLLNSDPDHPVRFREIPLDDSQFRGSNLYFSPWTAPRRGWEAYVDGHPLVASGGAVNRVFRGLSRKITVSEASEFFRLPLGSEDVRSGIEVNESESTQRMFADGVVRNSDITLGRLRSSSDSKIGLSLRDLTKHMFVCGTPGSGKTSFLIGLLDQLWNDRGIPFIVIEPAKNEYRSLADRIPDINIFTPGKEFISPLVLNPFLPPDNVRLSSYKRTLKTAFSAAVSMTTPLDRIFEDAVSDCYSDHGWSDHYTNANGGAVFNISEFIKSFRQTFQSIGYVGEAGNIGRAGEVRLRGLANLFDSYPSIPVSDLLRKPTVVELAAIENPEEKSLFIALILLSILSYVNANYSGDGELKNIVLLEEAHVLLDQSSPEAGRADPGNVARNLVVRMLAEARAYGLGMVVADQSPRKVGLDIVALADAKVMFRLVEGNDREIVAESTGMDENQRSRLSRLRPGEAFVYYNKLDRPEEITMPDYRAENGIRVWVSDSEISKQAGYWSTHRELTIPYPECSMIGVCSGGCAYECRSLCRDVSRRIFSRTLGNSHDKEVLRSAAIRLPELIRAELGDQVTPRSEACARVQFWRRVMYDSRYNISDGFKDRMIRGENNG